MFLTGFPASAFATNCYVVAPAAGEECVIVDPGVGVADRLAEILQVHRLRPAAVLLTHGHLDHVFSVAPVCGAHGVAAYVHSDDRYRLHDPLSLLSPESVHLLQQQFPGETWKEPDDVVNLSADRSLSIAGLDFDVLHAPGHTEGSVMFRLPGAPDASSKTPSTSAETSNTVLSRDVLFAGSVGRTDLTGGSDEAMLTSLREQVLPLPDDTLVLPGHGPGTTIAHERRTNPYLRHLAG